MRQHLLSTLMVVIFGLTVTMLPPSADASFGLFGSHKKIKATDGRISIPLKDIDDGKAHYFQYKDGDALVKFFVVQSNDGVIRAAFDACDVCFAEKKGYSQDGDFMICNNCGRRFHSSRINVVEGGCNPAPLKRSVVADQLIIEVKDILPGGRYF